MTYHVETTIGGRKHHFESHGAIRVGASTDNVLLRFTDGDTQVDVAIDAGLAARLAASMQTAVGKIAENGGGGLMPSRTFPGPPPGP